MIKAYFQYNQVDIVAVAKDVNSYEAYNLRISTRQDNGRYKWIELDEDNDELINECVEQLYNAKYGEELNFEVA